MTSWRIVNARALLPQGLSSDATVAIEDGRFAASSNGPVLDAAGMLVLPGIVDIHGDAFERQVMPRPGVFFDEGLAFLETDRQLVANGITTAFHALTWSWEPGLRGSGRAHSTIEALERLRPLLACDTRLHLRWEAHNLDEADTALDWIARGRVGLLAFNDHTPGMLASQRGPAHLAKIVERTGVSAEAFTALLDRAGARSGDVPASNRRLAEAARAAGVPMASHDDAAPADSARFRALGCTICEFPMTAQTAAAARSAGTHVVMGAPNVVRGGSHLALVSAESLVRDGLCDVLASDYYYPALLQAPWRLAGGPDTLARFWPLVSENPARAAGLEDRGRIEPGLRADCIIVDPAPPLPRVVATFVGGRRVHSAD